MRKITVLLMVIVVSNKVMGQSAPASDSIKGNNHKLAPWFVERCRLSAGYMSAVNNTDIKVGATIGGVGTDIDFEKDLGFDKQIGTFMVNFQWRISRRSRFDFSYLQFNRSSTKTLDRTIQFGDNTYNVSANVSSFFNTTIYRASWGYALLAKPKAELGFLIGTHTLQTSVGMGIKTAAGSLTSNQNFNFTAPLPDLGIWGGVSLNNRLALNGEFNYLAINTGDVSGQIVGYNAVLMYQATKHVDLSLGYTGFNFKVDANVNSNKAHIGWGYNGPSITAGFSFGKKAWAHSFSSKSL